MGALGAVGIVGVLLYIAIIVLAIASWWKIFEKAGQPGWAAIVPFYNYYIITVNLSLILHYTVSAWTSHSS